ncbi:MAG: hypothetical protein DRN06_07340 [Thermoprotei archaeon]|nr:MAG: hypothetical protein DRN06_07340 [Thermoprotei archaeon]
MRGFRVVFPKPGVVEIEEYDVPEPGKGQILVKNEVSLISGGTELTALKGEFPRHSAWSDYVKYPFYPGYCSVGEVVEVGEGVAELRVGDRVACLAPHETYTVINAEEVVRVPEGVESEDAVFHTIAAGVINSVRLARVALGESVVVIGAGLLGQMAVQFSRLSGAYPVIVVDLYDFRLKLARLSGATITVNPSSESVEEVVRKEIGQADVVFEVTGNPDVIPWAIKLLRVMGRFIVLSSPRGPTTLDFHDEVNRPSRVIVGTHFTSQPLFETPHNPWTRKRNTLLFFNLLKAGIAKVSHLITHRYRLSKAREAYKLLAERKDVALGVVFEYT